VALVEEEERTESEIHEHPGSNKSDHGARHGLVDCNSRFGRVH